MCEALPVRALFGPEKSPRKEISGGLQIQERGAARGKGAGREEAIQERISRHRVEKYERRTPRALASGLSPDLPPARTAFTAAQITLRNNSPITFSRQSPLLLPVNPAQNIPPRLGPKQHLQAPPKLAFPPDPHTPRVLGLILCRALSRALPRKDFISSPSLVYEV